MVARHLVLTAALGLACSQVLAQGAPGGRPSDEQIAQWRAQRAAQGGGEYGGPRPPENATPEERRAFWQKRAAERAEAEAVTARPDSGGHGDHGSHGGGRPAATPAAPPSGKPAEAAARGGMPALGGMGGMSMRAGGGALWLSDSPPARGDASPGGWSGRGGMGGMAGMGGERSGPAVKRLWLRAGNDPQKSGFAGEDGEAVVETRLVAPRGIPEGEPLPAAAEPRRGFTVEMPGEGFYRLYVTSRKLQGDTLAVSVAKAEIANFSHSGDEEERARVLVASRVLDSAPMEIVRERSPDEKPFFQLRSGDEQSFLVLQKGLPVQGARVRFVSHQGWTKEAVSDEQGRVSFQLVRDYFPPWNDFQKRFKATYLLIADASAAESGSFKDKPYSSVRYQATLAGSYYPSPDDYRSYAWGLGIGLGITALCGVGITAWRRRRSRPPFREVNLHG